MRKLGVLFCAIVAMVVIPCVSSGQFSSLYGGLDRISAGLQLYGGYATDGGNTYWTSFTSNAGLFNNRTWAFTYDPIHTAYLGLSLPIEFPVGSIICDGSLTIPVSWRVVETLGPITATPDGYSRAWSTADTMWTTVQGLYQSPTYSGISALAGFRWDRWDTSLRDPYSPATNVGATSSTLDEGRLTVDLYLPLIGAKMQMNGMSFGVIGFPIFYGDSSQVSLVNTTMLLQGEGHMDSGYFFEIFGDYSFLGTSSTSKGKEADLSLFWKINKIYAKGSMDGTGIVNTTGAIQSMDTFTTIFDRWMFVVGAQIDYTLPLSNIANYARYGSWFW